jgi:hypothetical protein
MRLQLHDFRLAHEILEHRPGWDELSSQAQSIEPDDVLETHRSFALAGRRTPAGAQTAINQLFRDKLVPLAWEPEPRLFSANEEGLRKWKMDFIKDRIGVEVSFNHAEAIPWTFTRLNIAGESREVEPSHRIDVGVAFFATTSLKSWGRMDSAVGTYDIACAWLEKMRPIMPIPILVVGLEAEGWIQTEEFRGTRVGRATSSPRGESPSPLS